MADDEVPKVDEEYLASLLGLKKWPCRLRNWEERTAARVVTDFIRRRAARRVYDASLEVTPCGSN